MSRQREALEAAKAFAWSLQSVTDSGVIADQCLELMTTLDAALAVPEQEPVKLWLWKNFVGGKAEYLAFDNAYPLNTYDNDPQTLGEPCGYAIYKPSQDGSAGRIAPDPVVPQPREWQPIETAPIEPFNKDHWYKAHSKPLLLSDARYNSVYIGSYNFTQKGKGRFLDVMGCVKQPTHWMPLPQPPKE